MLPPVVGAQRLPVQHTQDYRWDTAAPGAQMTGYPVIWRPWIPSIKDTQLKKKSTGSNGQVLKNMQGFHHPVRLFMPRSKIQEYLSHLGRKVLANFPVQATLHFYNDDSNSEEEDDETETELRFPVKSST